MIHDFLDFEFLLIDRLNFFVKSRIQVPLSATNMNCFRVAISNDEKKINNIFQSQHFPTRSSLSFEIVGLNSVISDPNVKRYSNPQPLSLVL